MRGEIKMTTFNNEPMVTKANVLDMQICVPRDMEDNTVIAHAELLNPCGTTLGWQIRKQGNKALTGDNERVPCSERVGFVHIMLEA